MNRTSRRPKRRKIRRSIIVSIDFRDGKHPPQVFGRRLIFRQRRLFGTSVMVHDQITDLFRRFNWFTLKSLEDFWRQRPIKAKGEK